MEIFSIALFVGSLVIIMSLIQIILVMFNDNKVWKKIDRLVMFFAAEKSDLITRISELKDKIEKLEEKLCN